VCRLFLKEAYTTDFDVFTERFELEHNRRDPKDSELCLRRVKSDESLMEARSRSNVQIDDQT